MSIATYAELQTAVLAWSERTGESAVASLLPDYITLCEARINQNPNFRFREMEDTETITLTSGSGTLPSDFLAAKRVIANYSVPRTLTYATPDWYSEAYPTTDTDESCDFYTIIGSTIKSKASATLDLLYYAKVPALASTDPNWLLTKAPNIYLYGTLTELGLERDDSLAAKYGQLFDAAMNSLIMSETFNRGGAMAVRASGPVP